MSESRLRCKPLRNIPTRMVLYLLSLTCIVVSFMLRTIMSFTILAMVKEYDLEINETNVEQLCYSDNNSSIRSTAHYEGTLEWSLEVQYYVLTSFSWTYVPSQLISGIAVQRFGTKVVVGYALLTTSLCNLCIPLASECHYIFVVILQLLQGLALGLTYPALFAVISSWIPLQEKGRFVTCLQGSAVGMMVCQLLSGFMIAGIGWIYVFYTIGGLGKIGNLTTNFEKLSFTGIIWCLIWFLLAYDKPELHPRITIKELTYIQENRAPALHSHTRKVPWKSILLSLPVWAISISSFGRNWIFSITSNYGPLYLKTIIGLHIQMVGVWSGVCSFGSFLSALVFSSISDKLFIGNIVPVLVNRKLFTGVGLIMPGLLFISISYFKCNTTLILMAWCLSQMIKAASFTGTMVNIVDITPNFTGPVTSIVQTMSVSANIFAPLVVRSFLQSGSTLEAWRGIFNVTGGVILLTYIFYYIFASAKVQEWDYEKNSINACGDDELEQEIQLFNVQDNTVQVT